MLKNILAIFILLLITSFTCFSQQVDWLATGGGTSNDGGAAISTDQNGNNYTVGFVFTGTTTNPRFGTDTISKGKNNAYDGFIVKHDVRGNKKWVKSFGAIGNDGLTGIKTIGDTSIVVVGLYRSSGVKLDTASLATPQSFSYNLVVGLLDTAGNVKWAKTAELGNIFWSTNNNFYTPTVDVNSSGDIVIGGSYRTSAKFDTTTISTNSNVIASFVASYSIGGKFNWVKNVSSPSTSFGTRVTLDDNGNIYCSGMYSISVTIDSKTVNTAGSRDIFLAKIDTGGSLKWLKSYGGTSLDEAYGLAIDKFNNLYLGGRFYNSFKVGDSTLSTISGTSNIIDCYIVRLDTAGKYIWGKSYGGYTGTWRNQDYCYGLEIDNRGNVGITGQFGGDKSIFGKDTVSGSLGFRAVYVSLVDSTGDFIWTVRGTSGQSFANQANGISLDTSKNIYCTGLAQPPLFFGDKIFSLASGGGGNDAYIVKFADCSEATKAKIFSGTLASACQGDSVKLWSNNDPNLEYRWLRAGFGLFLATDSTFKAFATDNYSLAISDEGCLDTSSVIKVTINKPIKPTITSFPTTCVGDADFTLTSATPAGGIYSGIGVKNDTVFSPSTSGIGSFNINYVYTDTNGCKDSTNKNIGVGGQSAFFTLIKNSVCQNEATFNLSGGNPTGGVYFGSGVSLGQFNPASVAVGTYQLGYAYTTFGCSDTAYQNITVNAAPTAGFSAVPVQCASTFSVNLSTYGTPGGGSFFGTGVIGSTFYPIISGAGSFTISYITSGSCKDTATRVIIVDPVPVASLTAFSDRCVDVGSFNLTGGAPAGGVYLYNGSTATTFDPSAVGAGTYTIKYAFSNTCGTDTATRTIKVNSLPTVTLSALSAVCAGASAFSLSGGSPVGGTYSGTGVNSTTGIFTPSSATAGTYTITYSYTDGNSCSNTATQNITVNAQPTVTLGNFTAVCIDNGLVALTTGLPTPGNYSGTGVSGTNFNPITAGSGTHTITYKHTDGNSCTDSVSKTIRVNALPSVSLGALSSVCVNASAVTLSGGSPTGGTYSGTGVNSTTGIFSPTTAGIGTHKITYTYGDANGCTDTASQMITVNGLPTVTLSALSAVCAGAPAFSLSGGSPVGGTYSGTGVNSTTGIFTPSSATAGTYTITYSYTDGNSCSNTATQNITVNAQPTVTLGNFTAVCIDNGLVALTTGLPTPGNYSGTGVSGTNFNPITAGSGTHTITYKHTDGNSCTDSVSKTIRVNALPSVSLGALSSVCVNASAVTLSGGSPTGGTYSGTGVNSTTGIFSPTTAGIGTHKITYTYGDANGCTDTASQMITVNGLPTVTLSALSAVCAGAPAFSLSGGSPVGGTYSGTGVNSTTGIFTPSSATAGTYTITYSYTDGNSCSNTATQNITVNAQPTVTLGNFTAVCIDNGLVALTTGLPTPGNYSGTGVSGTNFNPITAGSGTHTITYKHTDGNSCTDSVSKTIRVNALPSVSLGALSSVCVNASAVTLSGGSPTGGTYSGTGVNSTTGIFSPTTAGIGTHKITYTYGDANGCTDTASQMITVNGLPTVTLSALSAVCAGASAFSLSGGSPVGGTYSGTGVNSTTGIFTPSSATAGTYTITYSYTDGNSCSNTATQNITVNAQPTVTLGNFTAVCIDNGLVALTTGLPTPGNYSGTGVSGTNFNPITAGSGTHTITYKHTDGNSCTDSVSKTIRVNALPSVSLGALSSVCVNASAVALSGGSPTGGTYSGTGVNSTTGVFSPTTAGIGTHKITYTYGDANGCTDTASQMITVNGLPTVTLSALSAVCAGAPAFSLSGGSPVGGTYSGTGVNSTTGIFTPSSATAGTYAITYSYTDGNSCSNTATQNITVNAQPTVTLGNFTAVCIDNGLVALTTGLPTPGNYSGTGVSGTNFNPITAGSGTHTITYKHTDGNSCTDSVSKTIRVNALPSVSLGALSSVCVNASAVTLSGGSPTGGTYSGTGVNSTTGIFSPTTAGIGTHKITYTYGDANGCTDTASQMITVNGLPTVTLSALSAVCAGASAFSLSGGSPVGGTYSGTGVNSTTGIFTPSSATAGTYTITYSYTDGNSCSNTATQNITVNAQPTVTLGNFTAVCANAPSFTLSGGLPLSGTYFGSGVSSGSFDPSAAGNGIKSITYKFTDANSCTDSASSNMVVDSVTTLTFPALANICGGSARKAINIATPIGGIYKGVGVVNDTLFNPVLSGTGTFTLRYVFTNSFGCSDSTNQTIGVDTIPIVSFTIQDSICVNNDSLNLLSTPAGGVFSGAGVVGSKFSPVGLNGRVGINYMYTGANGCFNSVADTIRVDSVTAVAFAIPDSICFGSPAIPLNGTPMGGMYSLNGNSYTNTNYSGLMANSVDTIGYSYTNAFGCIDSTVEYVRVDSVTQVTLSSFGSICEDDTINLTNGLPLGGVYSGLNVIGSQYVGDTSGTWRISYTYTNQFGCIDSVDSNILVKSKPKLTLGSVGLICENTSDFLLTAGSPIGGIYKGSGIVNDTTFSATLAGIGMHSITYTLQDTNACTDSINFTLTVDTVPIVSLDSFAFACRNQGLLNLTGGSPIGGVYYGTGIIGSNQFDPSIGYGNYQVGYKFIDGKGCQDSLMKPIIVDTLPQIVSAAVEDICQNVGLLTLTKGNPATGNYEGLGIQSNGQFDPKSVSVGIDSLFYVLESRCGIDSLKVKFNVLAAPEVDLPPYGRICDAQEGLALTQGKPAGGLYFVDGVESTIITARLGRANVDYVLTNASGCTDTASASIEYYSNPEITVVGDKAICAGDSARFRVKEELVTYIWNGDTASSEYFLNPKDMILGENLVKLKGIDSLGCASEVMVRVNSSLCGFSVKAMPNPNDGNFALIINTGTEQEVDIAVWNTHGQKISGFNTVLIAGKNEFLYNLLDSAPGMYILEILVGQDLIIEKFVIK